MKKHMASLILSTLLAMAPALRAVAQSSGSMIGKTDIPALIEEAPAAPITLEEAARRTYGPNLLQPDHHALQNYYQPFLDKIDRIAQQYKDVHGGKVNRFYENEGDQGIQAGYAAEINKNPIIAQMGGVDKVKQMDEKQAEQAARQAAAQYIQDPFAANGIDNAGMSALYQKMMSDPAYAARFQKMSEKEREAELKKFMAANPTPAQAKTPQQTAQEHKAFEQQMQEKNKAAYSMEIQNALYELQVKMEAASAAFGQTVSEITTAAGSHHDIEKEYAEKYDLIPEIIADEAGRQKDPEKFSQLKLETAEKHRARAAKELKLVASALEELRTQYKLIASEYLDYIAQNGHKINYDLKDLYTGTYTELTVANFEAGLLGSASGVADQSKQYTREAAGWEMNYQETQKAYK